MTLNKQLKGFTLIEMIFTLVIASIISLGLYFIFIQSNKQLGYEEVLYDAKSYATASLDIISEKIRNADEIEINTLFNFTVITITNEDEEFEYTIENNLMQENGIPMKLYGHHLFADNQLYDIELDMECTTDDISYYESNDENLKTNIYDLEITINIQSKVNKNYEIGYRAHNRIFTINKFSQIRK